MKKFISLIVSLVMLAALAVPALAVDAGEARAVVGADLTQTQIESVYSTFGIARGDVAEITVTNAEERDYLEGIVDESVIGTRSISCVYIKVLEAGKGLTVRSTNISWCTNEMYQAAMLTAGITDAEVVVTAPFTVSGTAALTGIYKAYEDITGQKLAVENKETAAEELVITAELADATDSAAALSIINELKLILDEIANMTDDELRAEIEKIAASYGYTLTDEEIAKIISLCRSFQGLSVADLQERISGFQDTVEKLSGAVEQVSSFGAKVAAFFNSIAEFFAKLFGNG